MSEQSLSGTTILDLSNCISGPYCTKLLADLGAAVIKIEHPDGGDVSRKLGPFPGDVPDLEKSGLFIYLNSNKQGTTLDVSTRDGQKIFRELAQRADVVVENFPPGTMASYILSYEALEETNPGLVMTSLSPFGQCGPYANFKATEIVQQAVGGWMNDGGLPDKPPLKVGGSLSHYITGLYGAVSTLVALYYRNATGIGQHVDISAIEAMITTSGYSSLRYSYTGEFGKREGHPFPFTIMPCKDGYIGVNILTQTQWEMMCAYMGQPDMASDPRFATPQDRRLHTKEITEWIRPWLLEHTAAEIFKGQEWRVPYTLVPTVKELLEFPQHKARSFFVEVEHPQAGKLTQPGAPFKMSETPWDIKNPAPLLGQHNRGIFEKRLGYCREDLVKLKALKVI